MTSTEAGEQFHRQAAKYAVSEAHSSGESLRILTDGHPSNATRWVWILPPVQASRRSLIAGVLRHNRGF